MMNFRNLSITTKATASFIIAAFPILIVGATAVYMLERATKPNKTDIPALVQDVSQKTQLNDVAQRIQYYDEVLTQSARNYAFTQDKKWEARYYENVTPLNETITSAIELGDTQDKAYFQDIDASNLALLDMEAHALKLVDAGKASEAIAVLEGREYWKQKDIYKAGLVKYIERRSQEKQKSIGASLDALSALSVTASTTYRGYVIFLICVTLGAFLLAVGFGSMLAHTMSKRLSRLRKDAKAIADEQYNERITTDYMDEIGELEGTFNMMAEKIHKGHDILEEQVRERTKNLEKSEELLKKALTDAERINKLMVGRELEMVKLKQQLAKQHKASTI